MRVGVFRIQAFKPSETFIRAQAAALTRWTPVHIGFRRHGSAPQGVDYVELPGDPLSRARAGLLRDTAALIQPLRERGVRLIHAHFAVDAVYALPLVRALGVPLVTTLHGFDVTLTDRAMLFSGKPPWAWGVLGRRALQRRGAAFVAVSEFIAAQARARGYPAERLHVIPIGVPPPSRPSSPPEPGLIVHVGRLVEKKGTQVLLQALPFLPDARLEIVGDGPLRLSLEAQAVALQLSDRVLFHGALPHDDTLRIIARAAVLAAPSLRAANGDQEGLPTVIVEALARGVPVVASDCNGMPEAVTHDENGFLTPEGDAVALAARLGEVLASADLQARLSAQARRAAEARFDIVRQTAALEALYDRVVAGPRP